MKNLIWATTGLLLAVQVNAQQRPPNESAPTTIVTPNVTVTTSKTVTLGKDHHVARAVTPCAEVRTSVISNGAGTYYSYNNSTVEQEQSDDPMKTKSFSKSFSLDRNDKVNLSNSYGSITIKTWDRNEIKVDADIKAYATTQTEAEKLIDNVAVRASKEGDQVSYKTILEERSNFWGNGSVNGKRFRRELKVNLTVYMPKNNALNVSQAYGTIAMDDFSGPTSIKIAYGKLIGGDLDNANNYISAAYSSTSFANINQARIKQEYGSGITIGTIGTIGLTAAYTTVNINTIKNSGVIKQEYGGGINILKANNLTIDASYVRTKISTIVGNLGARLEYGGLAVGNFETSVRNVNVNSEYSSISLGFNQNFNANFTVNTDYAPFRYGSNISARKLGDDKDYSSSKSYSGQIGKGGANAVSVKAEYGSVTFK